MTPKSARHYMDERTPMARAIETESRLTGLEAGQGRLEEGQGRLEKTLERVEKAIEEMGKNVGGMHSSVNSLLSTRSHQRKIVKWVLGVLGAAAAAILVSLAVTWTGLSQK